MNSAIYQLADSGGCIRIVLQKKKDGTYIIGISDGKLVVGKYLAKGVEFAKAASYELSRLRTEVQDDNFLLLHIVKRVNTKSCAKVRISERNTKGKRKFFL